MKHMNKKVKLSIVFGILGLGLCFCLTSFAKYTSNKVWDYYLKSHGFYFSSDYLGSDKRNVNTLWDGNSVYFNLKNSISNNLITEYDISYTVTCELMDESFDGVCTLNGTDKSSVSGVLSNNSRCINNKSDNVDVSSFNKSICEMNDYVWVNQGVVSDIYFDVLSNSEEVRNVDVLITVNSTSPYKKTMTGIFNLYKNEVDSGSLVKQISNKEYYDLLVVSNSYDDAKCVSVSFDSSKFLVFTNSNYSNLSLDDDGYIKEFKFSLDSKSSEKITIYKRSSNLEISEDDFEVLLSSGC